MNSFILYFKPKEFSHHISTEKSRNMHMSESKKINYVDDINKEILNQTVENTKKHEQSTRKIINKTRRAQKRSSRIKPKVR